jgi:hypothetical protein
MLHRVELDDVWVNCGFFSYMLSDTSDVCSRLTKKAEPPPTYDVNRDSGTASANGGWLRRLVRQQFVHSKFCGNCSGRFS